MLSNITRVFVYIQLVSLYMTYHFTAISNNKKTRALTTEHYTKILLPASLASQINCNHNTNHRELILQTEGIIGLM